MGQLRDISDKLWSGEAPIENHHPMQPLAALEEVGERSVFVSIFANVTALDTDEGLVLVDTGSFILAPMVHGMVRNFTKRPLHTAVWTHGHVDHCFGVELYESERGAPKPRVVAHERVPARFERYRLTAGWNSCINARQFRVQVKWPDTYRAPDVTYADRLDLDVGGVGLELHHARGETDDATWVWIPSRKLLCTGDFFIWAAPNAGNPQKVQRYPRDWARALRQMSALGAETMCPGHGVPIFGPARVRQALDETAELLELLHNHTVELMNQGARLDDVVHTVRAPARLLERPYLHPIYDDPEFVVRNVWRLYGGWWDGNPAHLQPAPAARLAHELAEAAGGATQLAARATALAEAGDLALACHLAELAAQAAPTDEGIWAARAAIYRRRAGAEPSLMAKGVYNAAAGEKPHAQ